ncbi:DUF3429 family protein [Gammaproteobacteria bacterium]|jgi:predicted signal transduction protein with EAL and GGDEF domain|nr:DUF3429 family protein [Gammaproteobacteria bacterium]
MDRDQTTALLAHAGAIPFIACALLSSLQIEAIIIDLSWLDILLSYSLAIICFMSGAHWGQSLAVDGYPGINLFIISNACTLAAWFSYLLLSQRLALLVHALIFSLLWLVDRRLKHSKMITAPYYHLRRRISLIVVLCLLSQSLVLPS